MKVISNDACKTILTSNSSLDDSGTMKQNLDKALANGINYGLLCSQGKLVDENYEKLSSLLLYQESLMPRRVSSLVPVVGMMVAP